MPLLARPRQDQPRSRSLKLLIAAVESLLESGEPYANLTVAEITKRAGVARSTFYVHFSDRRELLLILADRATGPLLQRLERIQSADREPDAAQIQQGISEAVAFARRHAAVYRALIEAASYDRAVAEHLQALYSRMRALLEQRLRRQRDQGRASALPPRAAALALVSMVAESCLRQVSEDTGVDDSELVQVLATIWERGAYQP